MGQSMKLCNVPAGCCIGNNVGHEVCCSKACLMELCAGVRVAEDLAAAVEAPAGLPSRGAMAMVHTLQLAAEKAGHTHLPWNVLLTQTLRLMSSSGAAAPPANPWLLIACCPCWLLHQPHISITIPTMTCCACCSCNFSQ